MSGARVVVDVEGLAPGQVRAVDAEGTPVLVCNVDGAFYAIENRCPHVRIPLEGGRLSGTELECPLHGGRLDVRSGAPLAAPIRRPARTFGVRAVDGGIEIDLREDSPCTT
jgi:nitrite reductase/ring-hydroxylating ferredoxin subunit